MIVALIVWAASVSLYFCVFIIFILLYLFAFFVLAHIAEIGYFKIFGQTIEVNDIDCEIIGGRKIKDWKENWRLFFVFFTVNVLCFFVLLPLLLEHLSRMVIEWIDTWWPIYLVSWIFIQGHWAYKKYRSGKFKKAVRMLCQAKYENDGTFYSCLEEQAWRCRRIINYTNSAWGRSSDHASPVYESLEETKGRLKSYVDVNYEAWRKRYEESQEKKEKEDKLWEEEDWTAFYISLSITIFAGILLLSASLGIFIMVFIAFPIIPLGFALWAIRKKERQTAKDRFNERQKEKNMVKEL